MKILHTKSGYRLIRIISGRSNVFLLTNGDTNIMIDTTVSRLWKKIQKRLKKAGINHIDYLILTHSHFDHAGNAYKIKEKFNCRVIINKKEADYLARGDNVLPSGTTRFTIPIAKILGKQLRSFFRYDSCQYDILAGSFFDLKNFGFHAYILHTPGHTPGSMSIVVDNEIALVGDTMFGIFRGSVFPPFAEDIRQLVESWGKLLKTGCSIFIPSHGTANSRKLVQKDYNKRIKNYLQTE